MVDRESMSGRDNAVLAAIDAVARRRLGGKRRRRGLRAIDCFQSVMSLRVRAREKSSFSR